MNFDFSDEQRLLQRTAREYLNEKAPLGLCRQVLESDAGYSEDLWKGVAEMGWLGTAIPEQYGGTGFGYLELVLVAEEIGYALAPIPFSSSVYMASEALLLGGSTAQKERYLPKLAKGDRIATIALLEKPGRLSANHFQTTFRDGRLSGRKIAVADGHLADFAVVGARYEGATSLVLADLRSAGVKRDRVESIDPSRPQSVLDFANVPAELLGEVGNGWALVERVLDRAAVLLAFEQIGGAERALEITREFCLGRYAFGRPIASFQAIKHRLADVYVAIELARSNAYYAAWALSTNAAEMASAACGARASASDAFELASQEMIQFHGGVGFTWEYDCHLFYRRAKTLGVALGSADEWREKLIQRLGVRG
jgi:alkylation response protein AidB-like acyl-CoA dehydrogenase